MRHKPEDLLVHGDDLSGRRVRVSIEGPRESELAYLIVPEESGVEGCAVVFVEEVSETLEDVAAFKRLEHSEDNIEIPRPATA